MIDTGNRLVGRRVWWVVMGVAGTKSGIVLALAYDQDMQGFYALIELDDGTMRDVDAKTLRTRDPVETAATAAQRST